MQPVATGQNESNDLCWFSGLTLTTEGNQVTHSGRVVLYGTLHTLAAQSGSGESPRGEELLWPPASLQEERASTIPR